ncbi:MAG: hypothetical protein ABFD50_16125 [Smithella sp.]
MTNEDYSKSERKHYVEYKTFSQFWGWIVLIIVSVGILGFAHLIHYIVPDVPRQWDFGQKPQTPAESVFSTRMPPGQPAPGMRLVIPLPEALPPGKKTNPEYDMEGKK